MHEDWLAVLTVDEEEITILGAIRGQYFFFGDTLAPLFFDPIVDQTLHHSLVDLNLSEQIPVNHDLILDNLGEFTGGGTLIDREFKARLYNDLKALMHWMTLIVPEQQLWQIHAALQYIVFELG